MMILTLSLFRFTDIHIFHVLITIIICDIITLDVFCQEWNGNHFFTFLTCGFWHIPECLISQW